jgi:transcriptional regulator with XRE-family HTH domain
MADVPQDQRLYSQLGTAIAKNRAKRNMTQEQLASKLHLTRTSITNIERGRQHIQLHVLYRLAESLEVEVVDLLPSRKSLNDMPSAKSVALSDAEWLNLTISQEKSHHAQPVSRPPPLKFSQGKDRQSRKTLDR